MKNVWLFWECFKTILIFCTLNTYVSSCYQCSDPSLKLLTDWWIILNVLISLEWSRVDTKNLSLGRVGTNLLSPLCSLSQQSMKLMSISDNLENWTPTIMLEGWLAWNHSDILSYPCSSHCRSWNFSDVIFSCTQPLWLCSAHRKILSLCLYLRNTHVTLSCNKTVAIDISLTAFAANTQYFSPVTGAITSIDIKD